MNIGRGPIRPMSYLGTKPDRRSQDLEERLRGGDSLLKQKNGENLTAFLDRVAKVAASKPLKE